MGRARTAKYELIGIQLGATCANIPAEEVTRVLIAVG
jgi:hypothetical protein